MVNGRATMNNLRSSCVTLQYTCEDCAGYGNQPISDEEVVSCSTCNGSNEILSKKIPKMTYVCAFKIFHYNPLTILIVKSWLLGKTKKPMEGYENIYHYTSVIDNLNEKLMSEGCEYISMAELSKEDKNKYRETIKEMEKI